MYKKIAVSNRKIFFSHHTKSSTTDFVNHLAELCKIVDFIILREKDLSLIDYKKLASTVINRCNGKKTQVILHSHIDCCHELNYKKIHLPLPIFTENLKMLKDFETVGVSVHSLEQAIFAEKNNASYIIYSHIFQTDCKKDLPPKGLSALKEICDSVNIPVYALGGITDENESSVIAAGVSGTCRMSDYMVKVL